MDLSIINKGDKPATFPYSGVLHPVFADFAVIDHYNQWFQNESSTFFFSGDIYPDETRSGQVSFTLNPRSGNIALYVTRNSVIIIPSTVDASKIEANYDKGVLDITLPKAPEVKPKKITVATKKKEEAASKKKEDTTGKK